MVYVFKGNGKNLFEREFKDFGEKGDYREGKSFVKMVEMSIRNRYRRE